MQWSLGGEINWFAPRPLALAFIPALAIAVLALYVGQALTLQPRPGDEPLVLPLLIVLGMAFVGAQLLHLFLIGKTLSRNDG